MIKELEGGPFKYYTAILGRTDSPVELLGFKDSNPIILERTGLGYWIYMLYTDYAIGLKLYKDCISFCIFSTRGTFISSYRYLQNHNYNIYQSPGDWREVPEFIQRFRYYFEHECFVLINRKLESTYRSIDVPKIRECTDWLISEFIGLYRHIPSCKLETIINHCTTQHFKFTESYIYNDDSGVYNMPVPLLEIDIIYSILVDDGKDWKFTD